MEAAGTLYSSCLRTWTQTTRICRSYESALQTESPWGGQGPWRAHASVGWFSRAGERVQAAAREQHCVAIRVVVSFSLLALALASGFVSIRHCQSQRHTQAHPVIGSAAALAPCSLKLRAVTPRSISIAFHRALPRLLFARPHDLRTYLT